MKQYSQTRAMLAVIKASLKGQLRSPMSLVFGFFFPFLFILIFGTSNRSMPAVKVAFSQKTDTASALYKAIVSVPSIITVKDTGKLLQDQFIRGRVTAVIDIENDTSLPCRVNIASTTASADRIGFLRSILEGVVKRADDQFFKNRPSVARLNFAPAQSGRIYRDIDFVLPGQLGFSLLAAGLFGVAFLFFNLRETLVLKRMNATPLKRINIILGETLARVIFQMIITAVIILIGRYLFNFTLVNGWITFAELMVLSFIGLVVFMGFGFFISGFAKSINTIPAMTNMLGFPQFMLAGTFFPTNNLPHWLQMVSKVLPLTYLNNAMRKIAFEGVHLTGCLTELGMLALWGIIIYTVAVKLFKWE
jgi:ABC-2 type transport system permease protein